MQEKCQHDDHHLFDSGCIQCIRGFHSILNMGYSIIHHFSFFFRWRALPSASSFLFRGLQTSSSEIFALTCVGSSNVSCSSEKVICCSFGLSAFSSSIILQTVACGNTASSAISSNFFSKSFPSVLNP